MSERQQFYVEREQGGYGMLLTFEAACELAYEDSIERSCIMMVRHETEYVPRRIYHSGHLYELVGNTGEQDDYLPPVPGDERNTGYYVPRASGAPEGE